MIIIGVDAHKAQHAAVAINEAGRELARSTSGAARRWGGEGAGNYGRGPAQFLLAAGEVVYAGNPRWTATQRRHARRPGKNDRLDAQAVAQIVWREGTTLPPLHVEDETAVLDLLVEEREAALAEATRLRNQLHALLLQLDPQYKQHLPALTSAAGLAALETYQAPRPGRCSRSVLRPYGGWPSACAWLPARRRSWPAISAPAQRRAFPP